MDPHINQFHHQSSSNNLTIREQATKDRILQLELALLSEKDLSSRKKLEDMLQNEKTELERIGKQRMIGNVVVILALLFFLFMISRMILPLF